MQSPPHDPASGHGIRVRQELLTARCSYAGETAEPASAKVFRVNMTRLFLTTPRQIHLGNRRGEHPGLQ